MGVYVNYGSEFIQKIIVLTIFGVSFSAGSASHADTKPDIKYSGPEALSLLKKGNERFTTDKSVRENSSKDYRSQLSNRENPHTVIISCSDSRVPPEYIFDQRFGQIYSIRLTGEVLDSSAIASVEHAVEHLGAKLIVVMGHDNCDAIRAAFKIPEGKSAGSRHLDKTLAFIRPGIEKFRKISESDQTFHSAVKANVFAVSKHLVKESKIIFEHLKKNNLTLAQGIYSLSTGKVEFSDDIGPLLARENSPDSPSRHVSSDEPVKEKKKKSKKKKEAKKEEAPTTNAKPEQKSEVTPPKKEDKPEVKTETSGANIWEKEKKDSY